MLPACAPGRHIPDLSRKPRRWRKQFVYRCLLCGRPFMWRPPPGWKELDSERIAGAIRRGGGEA